MLLFPFQENYMVLLCTISNKDFWGIGDRSIDIRPHYVGQAILRLQAILLHPSFQSAEEC